MISTEAFHESRFESRHSIEIRGKTVDFTAIAEDFVFTDELGEAEASIFSYSYLADAENPEARPVLFALERRAGASAAASPSALLRALAHKARAGRLPARPAAL